MKQPKWCIYPNAVNKYLGCWSLTSKKIKCTKKYCSKCEYYKEVKYKKTPAIRKGKK
jgi:hypothetical protein